MKIKKYTTEELLNIKESKEVLVSHFLHRGDLMFLKAQKKVGKSTFAQCFTHACSSGEDFLGEYPVIKPLKVAYLFAEGAITDWKDRIKNMSKMHVLNKDNVHWYNCCFTKMYNEEDRDNLLEQLENANVKYDVIVWDCLYKFMFGRSTSDEVAIGQFNANEEYIRNRFNAASVVIHHDSEKLYRSQDGKAHSAASTYTALGSTFILANVTQFYTMQKFTDSKKQSYNKIILGDKRSGDLVEELIYYNIIPEDNDEGALGISLDKSELNSNYERVRNYIKENSPCLTRNLHKMIEAEGVISCSYETYRRIINKLIAEKKVEKVVGENGRKYTQWVADTII